MAKIDYRVPVYPDKSLSNDKKKRKLLIDIDSLENIIGITKHCALIQCMVDKCPIENQVGPCINQSPIKTQLRLFKRLLVDIIRNEVAKLS